MPGAPEVGRADGQQLAEPRRPPLPQLYSSSGEPSSILKRFIPVQMTVRAIEQNEYATSDLYN